jgi:hypothetical protein
MNFNPFTFNRVPTYYHVGIKPPFLMLMPNQTFEAYLNTLKGDWFRYGGQNYIVWTHVTAQELAEGARNTKGLENLIILVTPFVREMLYGYMPQDFWNWLAKPRYQSPFNPTIPTQY